MSPSLTPIGFGVGLEVGLAAAVFVALRARRREAARENRAREDRTRREGEAEALRREVDTATAVIEALTDGVWLTDPDGVVLRHNQALSDLLPAGQALVGQRAVTLFRSEALGAAVHQACREGAISDVDLPLELPRRRVLSIHVAPLGKAIPGPSVAVFRDLTELRRLERVRQEFVANVSHELRTPITAILGYSETLLGGALADEKHAPGMVEIIHRQSLRLSRLVADLLDLSRLEAHQVEVKRVPLALPPVTRRAVEGIAPRAAQKRISVETAIPPDVWVRGDDRAIEQVLVNLLDNAVKYTPEGGTIRVHATTQDGETRLSVRDSGVGIAAKHLPRLFERFYRVDPGRSRELGGTGLGLAIVKHLVVAMGGEVQVESWPGDGTEFSVLLPASPPQPNAGG